MPWVILLVMALWGAVYVGMTWTPSSYGIVLEQMGVPDGGPDWGRPRGIRSDEWAVITPLMQATVRNGFTRLNTGSFYGEDLRINYGLPIADWGMAFKPTLWPFFVMPPATAYSLHWFALFALFVVGHALLFKRLGMSAAVAALLSAAFYFTGFVQFWWSAQAPVMALFPWVLLTLIARGPVGWRLVAFYWLAAAWLLTNFYPPLFVSLAFVGALLVLHAAPEWRRPGRLVLLAAFAAASGATVAFYLRDYLQPAAATVYPGQRSVNGGGVPWREALAYLFPFSTFTTRYESVTDQNVCEAGVAGSAFLLLALCFVDHGRLRTLWRDGALRPLRWLAAGLALMAAWMVLPIPAAWGTLLLWNHVQPERMEYAVGLLLLVLAALLAQQAGLRWSRRRMACYLVLVACGWIALKVGAVGRLRAATLNDLAVLLPLAPALWAWRRRRLDGLTALTGAAAAAGALVLAGFNPLQPAEPIFAQHDTPRLQALRTAQADNDGTLAVPGNGAVYNGLGLRSVVHVTSTPQLAFWRSRYPDMPQDRFNHVFNRYAHILLTGESTPVSPFPDQVAVPLRDFVRDQTLLPAFAREPSLQAWLAPGTSARGRFRAPHDGMLTTIAPLVAHLPPRTEGGLHVQLCTEGRCAEGSTRLRDLQNNLHADLRLVPELPLRAGSSVEYRLWLEGAQAPLAFWTFGTDPSVPSSEESFAVEGQPAASPALLRMLLRFAPASQ